MFALGFVVGCFVGASVGVIMLALVMMSAQTSRDVEQMAEERGL